jgi:precorrin-8X/cobalt-precorrin-8 methylmutase
MAVEAESTSVGRAEQPRTRSQAAPEPVIRSVEKPTRFDRYVMVDWSASNTRTSGRDSLWYCAAAWRDDALAVAMPRNPTTRSTCMAELLALCKDALSQEESVLLGFDFPLGFPRGFARALGLSGTPWRDTWDELARFVADSDENSSNRFDVAAYLNHRLGGGPGPFWGLPAGRAYVALGAGKPFSFPFRGLPERRLSELRVPRAQPVWKIAYPGSVGSQALTGIPRALWLRDHPALRHHTRVWPFETGFTANGRKAGPWIVLAEILPSLHQVPVPDGRVKDAAQVDFLARRFARADADGSITRLMAVPPGLTANEVETVRCEEGWILGL